MTLVRKSRPLGFVEIKRPKRGMVDRVGGAVLISNHARLTSCWRLSFFLTERTVDLEIMPLSHLCGTTLGLRRPVSRLWGSKMPSRGWPRCPSGDKEWPPNRDSGRQQSHHPAERDELAGSMDGRTAARQQVAPHVLPVSEAGRKPLLSEADERRNQGSFINKDSVGGIHDHDTAPRLNGAIPANVAVPEVSEP
ncbi:hypothetical protein OPT61_g4443 [Boeremia exigua]|uniref:Uncharacterized protein n=1 Tax=Boeremia exigua TaxID=749465 RepID=A0ACC2IE48_9PLEO|nr:hypothetical protein OPT61_g4443 [Boeremia exigua]